MGKGHINRINNRPAAQSHTAHRFDAPKHGKTPQGFSVKPAKPEFVPIYSAAPKINLGTPTGKLLGAALLLAAAGSVIKTSDAQCINPKPVPHSFRNGLGTITTVNCSDPILFYGPQSQEYRPISRSFTAYHVQNEIVSEYVCRDSWGWNWASDCSTVYRVATKAVGTTRYESAVIMDGVSRPICQNNGDVSKFRGTADESQALRAKSLASTSGFEATCKDVASRCAQIASYECQTPTPTPTPTPSPTPKTTLLSTPQTSSAVITSSPPTLPSTSKVEATPSPTFDAGDVPTIGTAQTPDEDAGRVAGSTIGALAAAGIVAGGLIAAKLAAKKRDQDEENRLPNVEYNARTQTAEIVTTEP